jgi:hypothetical protein
MKEERSDNKKEKRLEETEANVCKRQTYKRDEVNHFS